MIEVKRNVLLNPGPATTTDTVKMAQIVPDICPREAEFAEVMEQANRDLVRVVHGDLNKYTAVLFCGSGTICMDICLNSLLPAEKKILIINNGSYSARAADICKCYSIPFINLLLPADKLPDLSEIEKILEDNPDIYVVYTTHNETGSGLLNPIREIGKLAHKCKCIFVVDTTSTYAMLPIDIEKDSIDFLMSSGQKGLMGMTGVSFIIGRKTMIEESGTYPRRSYYCNLYMQYDYFKKHRQMQFTPPVQTIYALRRALAEYFAEGEKEKHLRHRRVNEAIHRGLEKLGFKEYIKKEYQSGVVISAIYPDDTNWNFDKVHDYCYERGFTIYPGKISNTKTFRLCSFGAIDVSDVEAFLKVFEDALVTYSVTLPVRYAS